MAFESVEKRSISKICWEWRSEKDENKDEKVSERRCRREGGGKATLEQREKVDEGPTKVDEGVTCTTSPCAATSTQSSLESAMLIILFAQ
jgi:hypothetical protein